MSKWPRDNDASLRAFYGTPGSGGTVEQNLVHVTPPFQMYYETTPLKYIVFHRKAAPALLAAFNDIWERCGRSQARVNKIGASKTGGTYNPRRIRGSSKWSMHAYGCAIDIDPDNNKMGTGHGQMSQIVIDAFDRQGFRWGGRYRGRTDPMHFEAVDPGMDAPKFGLISEAKADELETAPMTDGGDDGIPYDETQSETPLTYTAQVEPAPKPMTKSKIGWMTTIMGWLGLGGVASQVDDSTTDTIKHAIATTKSAGLSDIILHTMGRPMFWVFLVITGCAAAAFYFRWRDYGRGKTLAELREAHRKAEQELADAEAQQGGQQ